MEFSQILITNSLPHYFYVRGYLTHVTSMQFIKEVNKHINSTSGKIVVDLHEVKEIDGSGIGILTILSICLRKQKRQLSVIANENNQPFKMLEELKLIKTIGVMNANIGTNNKEDNGYNPRIIDTYPICSIMDLNRDPN